MLAAVCGVASDVFSARMVPDLPRRHMHVHVYVPAHGCVCVRVRHGCERLQVHVQACACTCMHADGLQEVCFVRLFAV